jgi:hypothetical protein
MLDVLCMCCNCLDSCFVCVMLCAFMHVYVLFCFYLLSSCVSVFAAFERVLYLPSSAYRPVYYELMCRLRAIFCLFINVCTAFARAFVTHSGTRYSIVRCPSDYACVRWSCLLRDLALALLTLFAY